MRTMGTPNAPAVKREAAMTPSVKAEGSRVVARCTASGTRVVLPIG